MHVCDLRLRRQLLPELLDDREESVTRRASIRQHLRHFHFALWDSGWLCRLDTEVVLALDPSLIGLGRRNEGEQDDAQK
jgi:hypothetical protein